MQVSSKRTEAIARQRPSLEATRIDIGTLKSFVLQHFPNDSPIRNVILAERESLEPQEFLAKMDTWLKLLKVT